jgi:hypothetical protein
MALCARVIQLTDLQGFFSEFMKREKPGKIFLKLLEELVNLRFSLPIESQPF